MQIKITASSFPEAIREKLHREQARKLLAGKLLEGLDSGKPIPFTAGHFKAKKRALVQRGVKKKSRS
jgi:hypothetical protein